MCDEWDRINISSDDDTLEYSEDNSTGDHDEEYYKWKDYFENQVDVWLETHATEVFAKEIEKYHKENTDRIIVNPEKKRKIEVREKNLDNLKIG